MTASTSDTAPELSVIVPAHNAARVLQSQLEALLSQHWEGSWEIVVVDNGSTDCTADLVRRFTGPDSRVRLVEASERAGAGYARNKGVESAQGQSLAFCDADDVVEPGWVQAMGEALRIRSCVGGRMLFDRLNAPWLQTAFYTKSPDRLETFLSIFPISPSCNFGCQRVILTEMGGFDESFLTGQDVELCLRLWLAGHELTYEPAAVIQYRYRSSLGALWQRSRAYGAVGPAIARSLADASGPSPSRFAGFRQWIWLGRHLPTLRTRAGRARWLVVAGGKIGRLEGSIRSRRLLL